MNHDSQNTYPLPDCWLDSYKIHAKAVGYSRFPYDSYIQPCPKKARLFTAWVRRQLNETTRSCRGLDKTTCFRCKSGGYPEDKAMAVLANAVFHVDRKLSLLLSERARQLGYQNPTPPNPSTPNSPYRTPAVAMPKPKTPTTTDAISKK